MKRVMLFVAMLLMAGSLYAGDGKSCDRDAKTVQLTGSIEVQQTDSGETPIFRVADSDKSYTICDQSKVEVAELNGTAVRVSGKLVKCDKGKELVIESAARI